MEERNIKISLKKAREWYNSGNDALVDLALQAFNMNELEYEEHPKSIDEFKLKHPNVDGFYLDPYDNQAIKSKFSKNKKLEDADLSLITSKEETEAIKTLMALRLIRKVSYVKDFERDFKNSGNIWCIDYYTSSSWTINPYTIGISLFPFPTEEMAKEFLNNFKDELKKIEPLFK